MKKRILIDASTIINRKDGLSQYIIGLINNLPAASFNLFEYSILLNPSIEREELKPAIASGKFNIIIKNIKPIGPKREWDMFWFLIKNKNKFDLFHSTSNQYPFFLKNGIATIHDIIFTKYLDSRWWTFNAAKHYLSRVVKNSLYKSAAVIAVSNATKKEVIDYYKLNAGLSKKFRIIYEGWEHLLPAENENEQLPANLVNTNYLFYVGSSRIHKNLSGLIKGFIIALHSLPPNINLVISGDTQHLTAELAGIIDGANTTNTRIIFTGFVSNALLKTIFTNADAFIFPSLNEGFGIPVLESFYFQKPLLCSNIGSIPEIAGDAALYFNPALPTDIAKIIQHFYNNPTIWKSLIEKGQEQLKLFSWKKTGLETVELYKYILKVD